VCAMSSGRLLVIQHDHEVPLGDLADPLSAAGLLMDTWEIWLTPDRTIDLSEFDGVVSLGAFASVCDEETIPWIRTEIELLENALAQQVPVLGVCFGAQILARAAGGRVFAAPAPEMGWLDIATTEDARIDPVIGALGDSWSALDFHFDTFELPPEAIMLGSTPQFPQAYRIGSCAWGIQFHIEATAEILDEWMELLEKRPDPVPVDTAQLRAEAALSWSDNRKRAWQLATAFADQVLRRT
jgi:GMP synthase (glutamine-hydrolysing)